MSKTTNERQDMTESEQKTAVDIEQNWKNIQDGFGAIAPALPVLIVPDKPIKLETITTEDRLRSEIES